MTLRTAVACVLYLFGSGSLDEKAATLSMHKSTFDAAANRVIAELVERSNEVIYFPLLKGASLSGEPQRPMGCLP